MKGHLSQQIPHQFKETSKANLKAFMSQNWRTRTNGWFFWTPIYNLLKLNQEET